LIIHQRDSCALDVFDSAWREQLPPSSQVGHIQTILHTLESVRPQQKTSIGPLLQQLAEKARRRGLVFLISDCFDGVDGILTGRRRGAALRLRAAGHDETAGRGAATVPRGAAAGAADLTV